MLESSYVHILLIQLFQAGMTFHGIRSGYAGLALSHHVTGAVPETLKEDRWTYINIVSVR